MTNKEIAALVLFVVVVIAFYVGVMIFHWA